MNEVSKDRDVDVSVVICTYNRSYGVPACLDAIAKAIRHTKDATCEIVVVNNASTDDTEACVQAWCADNSDIPLQLLYEKKKGLACARNCGLRGAKGKLLISTDDDCMMDIEYINQALAYDKKDEGLVLRGGRVELGDKEDLPLTIKTQATQERWTKDSDTAFISHAVVGCNMMMRKELFERVGNFDEMLGAGTPTHGGEDVDYIYRTHLEGYDVEYQPDICVYHFHGRRTKEAGYKLVKGYSVAKGCLYVKYVFHPQFCRNFYWDLKMCFREWRERKNLLYTDFGFSYNQLILHNIRGAFLFLYLLFKAKVLRG